MESNAVKALGTKLLRGDGQTTTETFTAIAEVLSIDGPGMSREVIEVAGLSDDANEYLPGAFDGGEVSLELNFVPSDATHGMTGGLLKDFCDGVVRNFKLEFPDTAKTTWAFTAIVVEFTPSASRDKALTASVTLQVTGKPTFA